MNKKSNQISCDITKNTNCCSSASLETNENSLKSHWDRAYENTAIENLGWYEEYPEPSLRLIDKCKLHKDSQLLNVRAGKTTLIQELIERGFHNLIINDLSPSAIHELKSILGTKGIPLRWIEDDLTNPTVLKTLNPVDLWHDRAVLHFFTKRKDQDTYFSLIDKLVKPKGFVIIAAFNRKGATKCSGLSVHRYDKNMLINRLGNEFKLIENFDYSYIMPSGETREYIYTLFQRV